MTPDRFASALAALCWSQRHLASILRRDERQIRRWASGEYEIPPDIAAWLEDLATYHEARPPPARAIRSS